MSLIEEAIEAAVNGRSPELIDWAWQHPQASTQDKIACLNNHACPTHVLEQAYRMTVPLRKVALTQTLYVTDAWRQAVAKETSVQILRALIDEPHPVADEVLAAKDDNTIELLSRQAFDQVAGFYSRKMPQLFWKHSTDQHWQELSVDQIITRLPDPDCTGKQLWTLLSLVIDRITGNNRYFASNVELSEELFHIVQGRLTDDRELLVNEGFDMRLLMDKFQAAYSDFQDEQQRKHGNAQKESVKLLKAEFPWLTTYPWPTTDWDPGEVIKDQYDGFPTDVIPHLLSEGDYVGAANFAIQTRTFSLPYLLGEENNIHPWQRRELTRQWLGWALDSVQVTDEHIIEFADWIWHEPSGNEALSQINHPRLRQIINDSDEHALAWSLYRKDAALRHIQCSDEGQLAIAQALREEDPAVVDAADNLAPTWTGSLIELLQAARLTVN